MLEKKPRSRRAEKIKAAQVANSKECPHPTKTPYYKKRAAKKAARLTRLTVYKCRCGAWHLTSGGKRYVIS